ncbi:MAG: DNA-protecting protein DprA [Tissierellia bacterium]|nr:DNA-protecting protein DprA [Tissierellia bacterium]
MIIKPDNYPRGLLYIDKVPELLYALGDTGLLYKNSVTIVGSRKPTDRGLLQTQKIVEKLVRRDIVVVSGFAKGIDEQAHRAAFDFGGTSIAVLGTGLDSLYPRGRDLLRWKMEKEGLLLTEYPKNVGPKPHHFPRRNRLLAALSPITIIVEAEIKSGTMITAKEAIRQGKDLWVVPGSPEDPLSIGPNYLIFQGANPLYHYELIDHWEEELWQKIW